MFDTNPQMIVKIGTEYQDCKKIATCEQLVLVYIGDLPAPGGFMKRLLDQHRKEIDDELRAIDLTAAGH